MINKKESVIGLIVFGLLISFGIVFAATNILSPINTWNYTTTMNISCNATEAMAGSVIDYNVSVYYNASGGPINFADGNLLYFQSNFSNSTRNITFENSSVDISILADNRSYNFTCFFDNGTNQATDSVNITIDNTPPNVSSFISVNGFGVSNATDNWNYTNNDDAPRLGINVSLSDPVIGMGFVFINISFTNGTERNWSKANAHGDYYNYSINISTFPDGIYRIIVHANDSLDNENKSEFITVKFDSTAPAITFVTDAGANISGNFPLNISFSDATIGAGYVYFNVSTAASLQHNFTLGSSVDGTYFNITLNTAYFTDGNYTLLAYTNDSQVGNANNTESINFTIDNTAPNTPSFSCTPAQVYVGNTVTCTCSGTDATTGVNETVFTASPSTTDTGTIVQTCTVFDRAGNSKSTTTTYVVEQGSSGGGGGGGTTEFYTRTISRLEQEFSEIKTINEELREKQRVRVKINDETHQVGVRAVTTTSVTIEISSDPVQIVLDIGEDAKVDVNGDGFYDIYVKLNSITNGYADLTIDYLNEEIPVEEGEEPGAVDTGGEIVEPEEEKETSLTWLWITLVVVVIVIVVVYYFYKKK